VSLIPAGIRRIFDRVMLAAAYVAGSFGRRAYGQATGQDLDANAKIGPNLLTMRSRARAAVINNPHAARGVDVLAGSILGAGGVRPRCVVRPLGNSALAKRRAREQSYAAEALWELFARFSAVDGQLAFSGRLRQILEAALASGEALIRFRVQRRRPGRFPLKLEVLEGDWLDDTVTLELAGGGRVVQGVEFDADGARVAYHLRADHPGALLWTGGTTQRIDARDILHVYKQDRPGQVRGVTVLAPVLEILHDIDDTRNAEGLRRKMEACLVAFVEGADQPLSISGANDEGLAWPVSDSRGRLVSDLEPGMILSTRGDKKVTVHQPTSVGGIPEWMASMLHVVAAGIGVPYERLAADVEKTNYSSARFADLDFRRRCSQLREELAIHLACQPIWDRFVEIAIAAGLLAAGDYPVEWSRPVYESVDPVKDASALQLKVRNGLTSLPRAVADSGLDFDDVVEEIASANVRLDELGIILDSDPRRSTPATMAAPEPAPADPVDVAPGAP
jgi:lambda family phage portal protein